MTSSELSLEQLIPFLSELRLKGWGKMIEADLAGLTPTETSILMRSLSKWVLSERAEKKEAQIASKIRSAKFKRVQTVDNFDFSHSKATQTIQKNYLALHNSVSSRELPSAVFSGNAGLGKTHLARALGYAACQKGISTLFVTASEMVNQLSHAQKTYNLESELNRYRRPQVLIIDELGYVSLDAQASNLFFQVLSARHDQGLGTIATTNLPFGKFNQIFANDAIAHAIVDRLVNDAEVFFMEGSSYREHQRQEKQKRKPKS
jgi:DNA replication protein DnaC